MTRSYRIDVNNTVLEVDEAAVESTEVSSAFSSLDELEEVAAHWPLRRLVAIWNQLPRVRALARFEDRKIALRRLWRAVTDADQQPASKTAPRRRQRARPSKTDIVLQMLRRPEGATLRALMKATQWQAHSVRGFLSREVAKGLGLPLASTKRDGQRVYALASTAVPSLD